MLKRISSVVALVWISISSFAAFPPPFVHNPLDTNSLGTAPGTTYFLGWNGTKPAWTNAYRTNVLSAVLTTATSTNTATVYPGGADFFLVSATPCAITNVVGGVAGWLYSVDGTISNSTAAAFTNFMDKMAGQPRGYMATNFAGVLGFHGAIVPASAELFIHIETRGINETNYWLSY